MRTVVTNSEVPHLWAHQSQSEARNANNSFYFRDETIYSYRDSFPLAKHVKNARGEKAVLLTTATYSVTTSQHTSDVRSSIPHSVQVFHVDLTDLNRWAGFEPSKHVASYSERIQECERKAAKARKDWARDSELGRAAQLHSEALAFIAFYDLTVTVVDLATDLETVKAAVKADAQRKAKETRERKIQMEKDSAEQVAKWLSGEYAHLPYGLDTLLRVKDGEVETSRGARFPIDHARRGLVLVESVIKTGEPWHTNGHTCHLGNYRIDRIDANGTVHAGCHVVKYSAIERIKPALLAVQA